MNPARIPGSTMLRRIGLGVGWAAAAALGFAALNRIVRPESVPLLVGLQGVTIWVLTPAYPLAGVALWRRHRTLAGVAAGLCVLQGFWMVQAIGWQGVQPVPDGAQVIRLVTANVLLDNPDFPALAADLVTSDADVVVLQEMTPEHAADLAESALYDAYPHRMLDPRPGFNGSVILSRWPLTEAGPISVAGAPMAAATVETPVGPFRLVDVHLQAPINAVNLPYWRAQLAEMAHWNTGVPLVLAGDFNATEDHAPFHRLLDSGLRDAFDEAGSGLGATWPQWGGPVWPLMRLDHVLVSDGFGVVAVREQPNPGSDHRRLSVELTLGTGG